MIKDSNSLRDRLGSKPAFNGVVGNIDNRAYQQLKHRLHQSLLDRVDLEGMQRLSQDQIRDEIKTLVGRLLEEETVVINDSERRNLTRDVQYEVLGFGPL